MGYLSRILRFFLVLAGVFVVLQAAVRLLRRLYPFPIPPVMTRLLDSSWREKAQPRRRILQRSGLEPGLAVLELGPGPGYFTVDAARMVGPEGKLYAVDIEPRMIALVQEKVEREGLENVETRVADAVRLPFGDGTFDLAFLVTVLGEVPDKARALRELRRVLKPNGRLSVTEAFSDPDYMLVNEVVNLAQLVGFELVEQHGSGLLYTLNFRSIFGP